MLSKEEVEIYILNNETRKHPLLNEIYAIRDKRKETQDYTIYVDGYISVDVLNKTLELETDKQDLIEKLEEDKKEFIKELNYSIKKREARLQLQLVDKYLKILKGEKE